MERIVVPFTSYGYKREWKSTHHLFQLQQSLQWQHIFPRPSDTQSYVVIAGTENEIDFVCINNRWRTSLLDTRAYRGADVGFNHYLVGARVRLKLKQQKRHCIARPFFVARLKDPVAMTTTSSRLLNICWWRLGVPGDWKREVIVKIPKSSRNLEAGEELHCFLYLTRCFT